jgi:hypothetical protein
MGWCGRAPALPALSWSEAARQGAPHACDNRADDQRSRDRYRQELVSCRRSRRPRCDRAAAEVVAWSGPRLANLPPCVIGMDACVGAHHLARRLQALGHDARLMPAKYVRPYSKGQKNDFRDAEAIAEAVHSAPASDPRVSPGARDRCAAGPAFPTGRTSTHPECALRHSLAADGRM